MKYLYDFFGWHYCEYTKWEKKAANYISQSRWGGPTLDGTDMFQERHCIECGHIQQERLESAG
jgi:hypothetical protein